MTTWADIQRGIFAGESGGDYGALYGFANRPGKMFGDVDVRNMTINEVLDFQNPSGPYAQYVGGLNEGVVSSPAGAYQIIGTTLRDARDRMGLTGGEMFDPAMQDRIGRWIYDQQGTGAWEGYQGPRSDGMTPQPQQQQGLLGAVPVSDADKRRDWAGRLATAFNTLRQRPDANIPAMVEARRDRRAGNRTAEWLRGQPGGEAYAQMIDNGGNAAQVVAAYQKASVTSPTKGVAVEGRLINPITGEVIYEPESAGYDTEALTTLRKEFVGLRPVKEFSDQSSAFGRVLASAKNPSAAGDLALIFNYMKVLDPGSTVREGEFATAQNAGGVDSRARAIYNSVIDGTRLDATQRADFLNRATMLYQQAEGQFNNLRSQYEVIADQQNLPVDLALPSFAFSGEIPAIVPIVTPDPTQEPQLPEGVTAEEWGAMTAEERSLFQ